MIRFGPAGMPLSCKGRTLKDGIIHIHSLSLTALEVQMVRSGSVEVYPEEEDVGVTMRDLKGRFIIEIIRDDERITDPDEPIEEDDVLVQSSSAVVPNFGDLYELGALAKKLDVALSVHTPNYMDLYSKSPLTEKCIESIKHSALVENALGGNIVVTNLGLINPDNESASEKKIISNVKALMKWWTAEGLTPKLGIEISPDEDVYGSVDQITSLCKKVKGVVPVINWSSYFVRSEGMLETPDDFQDIIDTFSPFYEDGCMYTSFSGANQFGKSGYRLTPIKKGNLKFDMLADCLVDTNPEMTVISNSPLMEHDAMYMRIILERNLNKKIAKAIRQKRKEEAEV